MDFLKPFKGWSSVIYCIMQSPPSMMWWVVVLLKSLVVIVVVMLISSSPTSGLKTLSRVWFCTTHVVFGFQNQLLLWWLLFASPVMIL